jgi:aryl-alcohol dehydrogenase-like predicted oxidoreductase
VDFNVIGEDRLRVSALGVGCEPLGGMDWGDVNEKTVADGIARALDLGVNLFDTADVYGLGRSEERLVRVLGERRQDVVIATKFGVNWTEWEGRAKTFTDCRPERVGEAVDASLKRLGLESIPLYYIHRMDPDTPIEDTMGALCRCREAGKIQQLGVSNFTPEMVRRAHTVTPLAAVQLQYSLLDRHPEEELIPCCEELGIGVFCYGVLAQGFLTGKYGTESRFGTNDRRHRLPHFQAEKLGQNLYVVECLKRIAQRHSKTPAQIAIRWVLDNPAVTCAIAGVKTGDQAVANVKSTGWRLHAVDLEELAASTECVETD